jgi:YcaO-like protein with predicted kinase domain
MTEAIAERADAGRAVSPAETWARVRPLLPRFGITRVADVTRLDRIGLPVHLAYRPAGLTYAVTVGSGVTADQSRVGAVMESIETWHAENIELPIAARGPAAALDLGYDLRALNLAGRSPLTEHVVLDWVAGRGLLTSREILAPADYVRLDLVARLDWGQVLFQPTSDGLATGNTVAEAALHGLHELIERDSVAAYVAARPGCRYVDPGSCADPVTRRIYEGLRGAGCAVVACDITGPVGLPCYLAIIWSPDVPLRCGGFGCHANAGTALGRALAEAVQSRLATLSGARDDFADRNYRPNAPPAEPPEAATLPASGSVGGPDDPESAIRRVASLVAALTGTEPFAIRLDHEDIGLPVVKVLAPGLRRADHQHLGSAVTGTAP